MEHGVGVIKWSVIASQLQGRIGKQCREVSDREVARRGAGNVLNLDVIVAALLSWESVLGNNNTNLILTRRFAHLAALVQPPRPHNQEGGVEPGRGQCRFRGAAGFREQMVRDRQAPPRQD